MHVAVVVVVLFLLHLPSSEPAHKSKKPCDAWDKHTDCWKMQNHSSPSLLKHLDPCQIRRMDDKDDVNNRTLIIDPCMDEENRNFMECVLPYMPPLDPSSNSTEDQQNGTDTGVCRCYRWWHFWDKAAYDHVSPYNSSFNYELQSDEWFVWDDHFHECVVKDGMPCATIGSVLVHYRCQPKDEEHGIITQRCIKVEPEEAYYLVCSLAQRIAFNLNTVSFLVIFSYLNS